MRESENLPAKRGRGRPLAITPPVAEAICEHIAKHGWNRGAVAARAGIHPSTLQRTLTSNPDFADAVEAARGVFLASLEAEAYRRAVEGVETVKSITKEGEPVIVRVYSDALLAKLLAANGPEKHGQTLRVDKTVRGKVDHEHSARIDVAKLPAEDRAALRGVLQRRRIAVVRGEEAQDVPSHDETTSDGAQGPDVPMPRDDDDGVT